MPIPLPRLHDLLRVWSNQVFQTILDQYFRFQRVCSEFGSQLDETRPFQEEDLQDHWSRKLGLLCQSEIESYFETAAGTCVAGQINFATYHIFFGFMVEKFDTAVENVIRPFRFLLLFIFVGVVYNEA